MKHSLRELKNRVDKLTDANYKPDPWRSIALLIDMEQLIKENPDKTPREVWIEQGGDIDLNNFSEPWRSVIAELL